MQLFIKAIKFFGLFLIAATIYMFYSIYNEYYQGVRASESYNYAKIAAASTVEYFSRYSNYPNHIDDLKLQKSDSSYVGNIGIDKRTGIIAIRLAGNSLDEGMLIFTPRVANNASLEYKCQSVDVPIKYIPKECLTKDTVSNPASQPTVHGGG